MMNKGISRVAAAAAIAALPLLAACGSDAEPQAGSPTVSTSQAATPVGPSEAPPSATPSATPSSDPKAETDKAEAAAEKFVKAGFTIGYPDKDVDDYLDRLKPVMSDAGFAKTKQDLKAREDSTKVFKTLYKQKGRSTVKLKSDVKVTSITDLTANATADYQLLTQLKTGGDWKTARTGKKETTKMKLVREDGKWLVQDAT